MRWVRLLRLQLNRAVTGRMIPAASGIAFLHALSAVGFMQDTDADVWYVVYNSMSTGITFFTIYLLPTLVFSASAVEEMDNHASFFWTIRTGIAEYTAAKILAAAIAGFMTVFLGFALYIDKITKVFGERRALNEICLSLERGGIHGIIGRNGSGKTVLLKCICGFMKPTSGEIRIGGKKVIYGKGQETAAIIEVPGFIDHISGIKNLEYLAGIKRKIGKEQARQTMALVGLDPGDRKKVGKYSLGMRQRLAIAQVIMEDEPLIVLDEPMNGLDNQGVEDVRRILLEQKEKGKTILIASHSHEDIELLCDTVTELDHGKIIRNSK